MYGFIQAGNLQDQARSTTEIYRASFSTGGIEEKRKSISSIFLNFDNHSLKGSLYPFKFFTKMKPWNKSCAFLSKPRGFLSLVNFGKKPVYKFTFKFKYGDNAATIVGGNLSVV